MKILLAVSGGKDSMTMSDLALRAAKGERIKGFERFRDAVLGIAHCNFHLRPGDSEADATLVQEWAERHGLSFYRADFDTAAYAAERGISVEMAARELRYEWFGRLCREQGYDFVSVAHHAGDQAETLLLHLLRGCGLSGACAMASDSPLPAGGDSADVFPDEKHPRLLRPMLSYAPEEIGACVAAHAIPYREDKSNADNQFQRNLLRNQVLPLLKNINPSVVETLCRDAENFSRSADALEVLAWEAIEEARVELHGRFDPDDLCYDLEKMPEAARGELVFRLLESHGFNAEPLDTILSLARNGEPEGRIFLSQSWQLLVRGSRLRFRSQDYTAPEPQTDERDWQEGMPLRQPEGTTAVDRDELPEDWELRPWREGDWMAPLGMGGKRKKLSDLFTDLGFDAFDKEDARVLASPGKDAREGAHVLVLAGWRIDESVRVVPGKTRRILLLRSC